MENGSGYAKAELDPAKVAVFDASGWDRSPFEPTVDAADDREVVATFVADDLAWLSVVVSDGDGRVLGAFRLGDDPADNPDHASVFFSLASFPEDATITVRAKERPAGGNR